MVRASVLHTEGQRFESSIAHQFNGDKFLGFRQWLIQNPQAPRFLLLPKSSASLRICPVTSSRDIESSRAPLSATGLKALRLARILNDSHVEQTLVRQSAGGVSTESTEELENAVAKGKAVLHGALKLPGPYQGKWALQGMESATRELASRRTFIYDYAIRKNYEIRFSGLAEDVFGRIRSRIDPSIGSTVPDAVQKLTAVHDNLASDNPEDWANATHSCRRVLQGLADAVFPPRKEPRTRTVNGEQKEIKLGAEQYINRLLAYIEDSSSSGRFREIVGSHLCYMGDRLNALFKAAQKGSHSTVTKEEADRCVVYTYLLVGDILSLGSTAPDTDAN